MTIGKSRGTAGLAALTTLAVVLAGYGTAFGLALQAQEQKCGKALGKAGSSLAKTLVKATTSCRQNDITGKLVGSCPDAKGQAQIDSALAKLETTIAKSCASVCSISNALACVDDFTCPPRDSGAESCSGVGGNRPFQITQLKYPGPYCEAIVGHKLADPADVSTCIAQLTQQSAEPLVDVVYGSLTNASAPSVEAQACLGAISKAAQKLSSTIYKAAAKCRSAVYAGKSNADPATCRYSDSKLVDKVAKLETKLGNVIDAKCKDAQILELDLCNNGVGATLDTTEAKTCLIAAVNEITDSNELPVNRSYAPISLVNGAYPPVRGVCGDNLVNQPPSNFAVLGEECDGTDDSACSGLCKPPGDLYECTCANRPLIRYVADGLTADLDNGWTGTSQDQGVADRSGYVSKLNNCDCSEYTDATCTGTSLDPTCDLTGFQLPNCSWDPLSPTRCDAHGNGNGTDQDVDCNRCDEYTANPGTFCQNNSTCQSQCYDSNNVPQGLCSKQSECPAGQRCRGQCEDTNTCVILTNGAPLPISSGGTAVCILTKFRENVFGTRNLKTGEHAVYIKQFSQVHLGVNNAVPCPVCGGFCDGGTLPGERCNGRCSVDTATPCRFDVDCPEPQTCNAESPDCPKGSDPAAKCNLNLLCGGGDPNIPTASSASFGEPCRIEAATKFGTTSSDCLPIIGKNISGEGLPINFYPSTSEEVSLPSNVCGGKTIAPSCPTLGVNANPYCFNDSRRCYDNADCVGANVCTGGKCAGNPNISCSTNAQCAAFLTCARIPCADDGWSLYDCPCDFGVGGQKRPTRTNLCAGACDAAPNLGRGCATGAGNDTGDFTKCDGGVNDDVACDGDSDCGFSTCNALTCAGGANVGQACATNSDCPFTCSKNPTHCEGGDPAFELLPCATSAECPGGGSCVDACPGGRCEPLCLPGEGGDIDDGYCAAGPSFHHCSGEGNEFRTCTPSIANADCTAVCATTCTAGVPSGGSGSPCDGTGSCPAGESCCGVCNKATTCGAGSDAKYGTNDDIPGAGICVPDIRLCFVNNMHAEGGDTLNGKGDPTNVYTVTTFCIDATSNGAVNQTAGLGGPGRLRQNGVNIVNGVLP